MFEETVITEEEMRCFAHPYLEANSVCNICGKAMCSNCSSYSNHSGRCPMCRRIEYLQEKALIKSKLTKNVMIAILGLIAGVILCILFTPLFLIIAFGIPVVIIFTSREAFSRLKFLNNEILKIEWALSQGNRQI